MYFLPIIEVPDILVEARASAREAANGSRAEREADWNVFGRGLALTMAIQELYAEPLTHKYVPFLVTDGEIAHK